VTLLGFTWFVYERGGRNVFTVSRNVQAVVLCGVGKIQHLSGHLYSNPIPISYLRMSKDLNLPKKESREEQGLPGEVCVAGTSGRELE